jgi:mono/diheme cytochrome c family protein
VSKSAFAPVAAAGAAVLSIFLVPAVTQAGERAAHADANPITVERGRYVAKTAGCNDCHTAGYMPTAGKVPEAEWLKGDRMGWRGPWGTTYAPNLRITLSKLSEDQWVAFARSTELRPPMPWFALRELNEGDLRSFYRFVRSLGAPGQPAPAYLPPGVEPTGPYAQFPSPPPATAQASQPKPATTAKLN